MRANMHELLAEIKKAEMYLAPARIVFRYRALHDSAGNSDVLAGITMREMLQAVTAADAGCLSSAPDDALSHMVT